MNVSFTLYPVAAYRLDYTVFADNKPIKVMIEVFSRNDISAQNNLQKLFHLEDNLDYKKNSEITALGYPYASLVYFHLFLQKLYEKGVI